MNDEQQDSFELFADTLTITLGCIIFIALLLVTITRSHQLDQSGLFHFERRSELLSRQIAIAENALSKDSEALENAILGDHSADFKLKEYENNAAKALRQFLRENDRHYAQALLSENLRSQLFLTKLPWMLETIQLNINSIEDRINRAFAAASETPIAVSLLREQAIDAPIPAYVIIYNNKLFPVPAGPGREYPHIKWTPLSQTPQSSSGEIWQLSPQENAGMDLTTGMRYLEKLAAKISRDSKSQIVLLVYADSFQTARSALRELSKWSVNFSWRPFKMEQRILMREGGLPPDSPF